LGPGTRLGPYEITAKLGEGGMGEVYRARDTKLDREVAIKVLPAAFTEDPERLTRFEREAKLLAQLHHPNIASIFGLEDSGGIRALVMELVEGPTLAERLEAGPLSLEESLSIAKQIAQALEEAHEKGIVHRDLKPQNIKASVEGKVKVLDFGLAKAMDPAGAASGAGSASQLAQSPTLTLGATQMGVILGTAAYMAPEQAAGGVADRRADIWAFGVVFYEMLTGKRLFEGETVSHVLAGVLKDTPDFSALPAETPERIRNLVRRCLKKKPRERLQSIGDARVVLEEVIADPDRGRAAASETSVSVAAPARASRFAWILATSGLVAATLFASLWLGATRKSAERRSVNAALVAPPGTAFTDSFALSPDGRRVVFEAYDEKSGVRGLWVRELDRSEPTKLAPANGGEMPFWSPDGNQIGFFADGKLQRLDLRGGPAQSICDAPTPRGGAWGPDGRIVFSPAFRTGLSIVAASGGAPQVLTTLDAARGEKSHRFPSFLPGGKVILFLAQTAEGGSRDDQSAIEGLDLASGKRTRLVTENSSPLFSPPGQLLYWREGTLFAQRFDPGRLAVAGEAVAIASPVAFTQNEQALATVSGEGTLLYRAGTAGSSSSLVALDRRGVGVKPLLERELFYPDFALSPDGGRLAYSINGVGQGSNDLWVLDLERGLKSRLSFEEGNETRPAWSPDGRYVYYSNDRRNDGTIFRRAADGTGAAEEVGTTPQGIWSLGASHDGKWLLIGDVGARTNQDILRFDLATKAITPLVETPFVDAQPAISPDDRLLAYDSEQSGRSEIYVQALDGERGRWQISSEGGAHPRWRGDGRELYFLVRPDLLMVVDVDPGPVPRFSAPRELFREPTESFDVSPDGQRFVALRSADRDDRRPLTLITNWQLLVVK
jgi:dipeptidyl aminopeptidase/acylaminoacyl peptidase/aminoglycoside phosphotransferase (APT) family kinase protein